MDRAPGAPDVGMASDRVTQADFALIGHAHWDHLAGADVIAKARGTTVIGSHESARVLMERGVASTQLWRAQGGEHFRLSDDVTVRVFPSLHSCIWSRAARPGVEVTGDLGVTEDEREARLAANRERAAARGGGERLRPEWAHSDSIGGALDFLIDTPDGTVFFQDSMGYWTGIYSNLPGLTGDEPRIDLAILAAAGRGNIDGEPIQGSVEQFIARECELLRPRQVILSHHDNFAGAEGAPDITDLTPVHEALARVSPRPEVVTVELGGSVTLL
jgi:L-ascorbate metabolism protein UlaG (beta-lactamase superfamily)